MERTKRLRTNLALWSKRLFKWALCLVLAYLAVLLIGLVPVNNDFESPDDGVKIFVISNAVHADIIVPSSSDVVNWHEAFSGYEFVGSVTAETHVAFGWRDRGFFLETETWDDFKVSTAANALLLPSNSCMHVSFTRPEYFIDAKSVTISKEQYKRLVDFIKDSFNVDKRGNFVQIDGYAYSNRDAFFDANGHYHFLNTCNSWAGRGLKTCGVRVPWLSPIPKSPMLYIPTENIVR